MLDRRTLLTGVAAGAAAAVSGCSWQLPGLGDTVTVAVAWSGAELAAFRSVLRGLDLRGYRFELIPMGDDISTALSSGAGRRPDIVMLPQPGLVMENRDRLKPLPGGITKSWAYADVWRELLLLPDRNGEEKLYGLPFKMAYKSAVWYRRSVFADHGLTPPQRWSEWLRTNQVLAAEGRIAPLALAGADGWMLTDFFENVLMGRSPDAYQKLTCRNRLPLADEPAVQGALELLGGMWAPKGTLAGGATGSLVRQYGDAVADVFGHGRAAMVLVPDFAEPMVQDFVAAGQDIGVFRFPEMDSDDDGPVTSPTRPLIVGGDVAVLSSTASDHAVDLVVQLSGPGAPLPWIEDLGGFLSAHQNIPFSRYSPQLWTLASDMSNRPSSIRFDLSDRLGRIGGSGGLWRVLQEFLAAVGGRDGSAADISDEAKKAVRRLRDPGR